MIVISLDGGTCCNFVYAALAIWQRIEAAASVDQSADALCDVYEITSDVSREAMDGFRVALLAKAIMALVDDATPPFAPFQLAHRAGGVFTPPVLTTHTNMFDLPMLDTIHDVDEQEAVA